MSWKKARNNVLNVTYLRQANCYNYVFANGMARLNANHFIKYSPFTKKTLYLQTTGNVSVTNTEEGSLEKTISCGLEIKLSLMNSVLTLKIMQAVTT